MRERNIIIGVALCVWNGSKTIEKTVSSIINQSYIGKVNIIILDNRSDDNTVKLLKKIKKKNKKKNINIKILIDKKKRNVVAAQNYLIKKYFKKFEYFFLATDDEYYHRNFIASAINKLTKQKLDLVYTNYQIVNSQGSVLSKTNKPIYSFKKSKFLNLSNFIIYRNINPIIFGIYRTKSFMEIQNYYNYFDQSMSNHDNLFIFNFLLNKKVGNINKNYFYFLSKNRNLIEKLRKSGPKYWKLSSLISIFKYQFNFSVKISKSIANSKDLKTYEKIILYLITASIYFQKTISYIIKFKYV